MDQTEQHPFVKKGGRCICRGKNCRRDTDSGLERDFNAYESLEVESGRFLMKTVPAKERMIMLPQKLAYSQRPKRVRGMA